MGGIRHLVPFGVGARAAVYLARAKIFQFDFRFRSLGFMVVPSWSCLAYAAAYLVVLPWMSVVVETRVGSPRLF
jgi:hypothetical protein